MCPTVLLQVFLVEKHVRPLSPDDQYDWRVNFIPLITNQFAVSFAWIWHPTAPLSVCLLNQIFFSLNFLYLVHIMLMIWIVILKITMLNRTESCTSFSSLVYLLIKKSRVKVRIFSIWTIILCDIFRLTSLLWVKPNSKYKMLHVSLRLNHPRWNFTGVLWHIHPLLPLLLPPDDQITQDHWS